MRTMEGFRSMFHLKHARGSVCGLQACDLGRLGTCESLPILPFPYEKENF